MKIAEAGGCIEFWLNRYQSGIGGLLALIGAFVAGGMALAAAGIAAKPVLMQLKESERQTALLALPVLREMIGEEVFEESCRAQIEKDLLDMRKMFAEFAGGNYRTIEQAGLISTIKQTVDSHVKTYAAHTSKTPRGPAADQVRGNVPHLAHAVGYLLDDIRSEGDALQMGLTDNGNFQAGITRACVRFASHDVLLTAALFEAHSAGEVRRERLTEQIGRATDLALS